MKSFIYITGGIMQDLAIMKNKRNYITWISNGLSLAAIAGGILFAVYGYYTGIFESRNTLVAFFGGLGIWAPILFVFLQALQVIIPVLPGFVTCIAGAIVFGPVAGFFYSYIGVCIGSAMAFYLARKHGTSLVKKLISEKTYDKYIGWLERGKKFDVFFLLAIFLPAAPDDILCFIAGLTKMNWQKFTLIILAGKPFVIALYSLVTAGVLRM